MEFSVWPNSSRPWTDLRRIFTDCDRAGWWGGYLADHFMPDDPSGRPVDGPRLECWTALAALADATDRMRLAPLVSGNLYRHPAVVAKASATVDHISGGRFAVGLGAGWQVNEHAAYGIDLVPVKERLDRLEEAAHIVSCLLREPRATFKGAHYRLEDAPCDPKPVQARLPLIIGGTGRRRTMRIAARYADEWNGWSTPETLRDMVSVLDRHCEDLGRDPASIRRSTQAMVFLSTDESWVARQRERSSGMPAIIGTPAEVVERVAAYRDAGADELIVPDWTMGDAGRTAETLALFWEEVAVHFR